MTNMPVHVVGIGSTGSHVAYAIAKTRTRACEELHVWDFDYVTRANCRNQAYTPDLVHRTKTNAMCEMLERLDFGALVRGHCMHLTHAEGLSGVVFLCAGMNAHKDIVLSAARLGCVELFIETRMDAEYALIHVFDPRNERHVEEWLRWWYSDNPDIAPNGCGVATAGMPIGILTASMAVAQLMRYATMRSREDTLDNQIRISMRPPRVETYQWD